MAKASSHSLEVAKEMTTIVTSEQVIMLTQEKREQERDDAT